MASLVVAAAPAGAQWDISAGCNARPEGRHGPFDYRTQTKGERSLVERYHFNAEYKAYLLGKDTEQVSAASRTPAAGFSYTLDAFPNHYQALAAMDKISHRQGKERAPGAENTTRCYFERAIAFVPDDPLVRALYAVFLARRGERSAVDSQVEAALKSGGGDANVLIQIASAYLLLENYDQARNYAKKAYALGYPLFGIRDRLVQLGKWE